MFKKILVPLDGSMHAEQAIPVAASIARACEGSVVLLQVAYPSIGSLTYVPEYSSLNQTALDAEITKETDYLQIRADAGDLADIKTEIKVLVGSAASTILSFAESIPADIIVMSSHGYTGLKRWVLGSVADKLVRHASVPVLVLRDEGHVLSAPQEDTDRPLRALVALDGSALAEAVLEPTAYLVAALAIPTQGALHLMRVVDLPPNYSKLRSQAYIDTGMLAQATQEAEAYLRSVTDRLFQGPLADLHLAVTTSVVNDLDVAEALIMEAEGSIEMDATGTEQGCALLAMATHGHTSLQRWALGSVTERVLHATKLPLLVVRPRKEVMLKPAIAKTTETQLVEREKVGASTQPWVGLF